jgi:hypothetical protein
MKIILLLFLSFFCVSEVENNNQFFNKKDLIGKWRVEYVKDKDSIIYFKDFSKCRKKEYLEFVDSIRFKNYSVFPFKDGCMSHTVTGRYSFFDSRRFRFLEGNHNVYKILELNKQDFVITEDYNNKIEIKYIKIK